MPTTQARLLRSASRAAASCAPGRSSSISVSRRASDRRSPAIARSARRDAAEGEPTASALFAPARGALIGSARFAAAAGRRDTSDDDERLAEAEVAAQARADLLVRQAGARAVDDRAEDVAVLALRGA